MLELRSVCRLFLVWLSLLCLIKRVAPILSQGGFSHKLLPVSLPNTTFLVGKVHHQWCLTVEAEQVALFASVLQEKRNRCLFVDVGMNDGFYTNMAASFGCQVYAFEVQPSCIEISRYALRENKFESNVTILSLPVSKTNGEPISISFPERPFCDGAFTFSGPKDSRVQRTHAKAPLIVNHTYSTISLDSFIPHGVSIDILKVDVEGHEAEVLAGAMSLLRERRIGRLVIELGERNSYQNWTNLMEQYHRVVSMNYSLTTFNCHNVKKRGPADVFTLETFDGFSTYATWKMFTLWRCPDILVTSMI